MKKDAGLFWQYQSTKLHYLEKQKTIESHTEKRESPKKYNLQLLEAPLRNRMKIIGCPVDAKKALWKKTSFISQGINKRV